jgi:dihydrofolate reductase
VGGVQPLTVDIFLSVDGWAKGDAAYFGYDGPELAEWISMELARPQLVLFGRRTYEALGNALDDRMAALDKVVFSRTLTTTAWPNSRLCGDDAVTEVGRLKREGDVPLRTMGSLSVARQLGAAGLVDRLRLMTFPLLAGTDGREWFFDKWVPTALELAGIRVLDGRVLLIEYGT